MTSFNNLTNSSLSLTSFDSQSHSQEISGRRKIQVRKKTQFPIQTKENNQQAPLSLQSSIFLSPSESEQRSNTIELTEQAIQPHLEEIANNHEIDVGVKKYMLAALGISFFDFNLTNKISFALSKYGICFGNVLPKTVVDYLWKIELNIGTFNSKISTLFPNNVIMTTFIKAFCEEIEFRWFVQHIVLKKLPEKILGLISPELTKCVDSTPARITRIAAASLIFALIHAHTLECDKGGGLSQLIGGILYGTLCEYSDSIVHGINLHIIYNLFVTLLPTS